MATYSRSPNKDLVGSIPERILRDQQNPTDLKNPVWDEDVEESLVALRVTYLWRNSTTQTPQNVALYELEEEEIEEELEPSKDEHILASQTVYVTPGNISHIIKAARKVQDEI